jgi:hypothetical protein
LTAFDRSRSSAARAQRPAARQAGAAGALRRRTPPARARAGLAVPSDAAAVAPRGGKERPPPSPRRQPPGGAVPQGERVGGRLPGPAPFALRPLAAAAACFDCRLLPCDLGGRLCLRPRAPPARAPSLVSSAIGRLSPCWPPPSAAQPPPRLKPQAPLRHLHDSSAQVEGDITYNGLSPRECVVPRSVAYVGQARRGTRSPPGHTPVMGRLLAHAPLPRALSAGPRCCPAGGIPPTHCFTACPPPLPGSSRFIAAFDGRESEVKSRSNIVVKRRRPPPAGRRAHAPAHGGPDPHVCAPLRAPGRVQGLVGEGRTASGESV